MFPINKDSKINRYNKLKLGLIISIIYLLSACGYKIEEENIEPYYIKFKTNVYYAKGLKGSDSNPFDKKIGTTLVTEKLVSALVESLFESGQVDINPISGDMTFLVKKKYSTAPYGLQKVFTSGGDLFILVDEDGVESVLYGTNMFYAVQIDKL